MRANDQSICGYTLHDYKARDNKIDLRLRVWQKYRLRFVRVCVCVWECLLLINLNPNSRCMPYAVHTGDLITELMHFYGN